MFIRVTAEEEQFGRHRVVLLSDKLGAAVRVSFRQDLQDFQDDDVNPEILVTPVHE